MGGGEKVGEVGIGSWELGVCAIVGMENEWKLQYKVQMRPPQLA